MERGPKQLERDSIGVERSNHASTSHPKGTNRSSGGMKCPLRTTLCAATTTVRASAPEGIGRRRRALGRCRRGYQHSTIPEKKGCRRSRSRRFFRPFRKRTMPTHSADLRDHCRRSEQADDAAPLIDRPPSHRAARVPRCLARARAGSAPESRKPAAHRMWPRVLACIVWRRFPKKPRPRVGGKGFEPLTSTV